MTRNGPAGHRESELAPLLAMLKLLPLEVLEAAAGRREGSNADEPTQLSVVVLPGEDDEVINEQGACVFLESEALPARDDAAGARQAHRVPCQAQLGRALRARPAELASRQM
jgi:hypothetical protein